MVFIDTTTMQIDDCNKVTATFVCYYSSMYVPITILSHQSWLLAHIQNVLSGLVAIRAETKAMAFLLLLITSCFWEFRIAHGDTLWAPQTSWSTWSASLCCLDLPTRFFFFFWFPADRKAVLLPCISGWLPPTGKKQQHIWSLEVIYVLICIYSGEVKSDHKKSDACGDAC